MSKPAFYADGLDIWKSPVHKKNADGSESITLGFRVCRVSDEVGAIGAAVVAQLLTLGDANASVSPTKSEGET